MTRATIADVARDAGVNKATASRALRGLPGVHRDTRARVLSAADHLNYSASEVATALATGRSRVVGVIVPSLRSWFFSTAAAGASSVLQAAGYRVDLITADIEADVEVDGEVDGEDLSTRLSRLAVGRDALLLAGRLLGASTEGQVPAVLTATDTSDLYAVTGLGVDYRAGMRLLGCHLVDTGHRRIAVLDGRRTDRPDTTRWQQRTDGIDDALQTVGQALDPGLIVQPGNCDAAAGERAMRELLEITAHLPPDRRPSVVVCHNDEMAFGALAAIRRAGLRVPDDWSVAGFDNHPTSKFWGLTTVTQHTYSQGVQAGLALLRQLEPRADPPALADHVTLGTTVELCARATTGRVRASP